MKNCKKILSIILTICMIMQILPVLAAEGDTGVDATPQTVYFINDQFETAGNTDGWAHGVVNEGFKAIVEQATEDETGVLKVSNEGIAGYDATSVSNGSQTVAIKSFSEIPLTEDNSVYIKTRVKHTQDTARFYMKFNRPDSITLPSSECGANLYTLFVVNKNSGMTGSNGLNGDGSQVNSSNVSFFSGALAGKWIDVDMKMYMSGGLNMADITASVDGGTPVTKTVNLKQPAGVYTFEYGDDTTKTAFDVLKTLAFTLREKSNTLYVDYVQGWVESSAEMEIDGSYAPGEAIEVAFNVPLNDAFTDASVAVKLYDKDGAIVEAQATADAVNNTVTLIPKEDITVGEYYTIGFDKSKVYTNYIIKEKQFYASYAKYITYDDFNNGELGNWKLGKTTVSEESYKYGVEDNAMYFKLSEAIKLDVAGRPTIVNDFKNVEYQDGKNIVIKAKLKTNGTTAGARIPLKLNRPDNAALNVANMASNWYTIGELRGTQYADRELGKPILSGTLTNQWVDVEIRLDGINKTESTKVTYNGETYPAKSNYSIAETDTAAYTAAGVDTTTGFTSFDSLTFTPTNWYGDTTIFGIWVDYLYAYEELKASLGVNDVYKTGKPIQVKINTEVGSAAFKDAVEIYDESGNKVPATNTIDKTNTVVTVTPEKSVAAGEYEVRLNPLFVPENYVFDNYKKAFSVGEKEYLIYDEFADGDTEDWNVKGYNTTATCTLGTAEITEGSGNYALTATVADDTNALKSYIEKELAFPVTFTSGTDVVIETKLLQTEANGRTYFKFNMPAQYNAHEREFDYGTLILNNKGSIKVPNGWVSTNPYNTRVDVVSSDATNKWYDVKVTIHGNTKKATYVVTDEDGHTEIKEEMSIDYPETLNYTNYSGMTWVENVLNTFNFRFRDAQTLKIDYFKVYTAKDNNIYVNNNNGRYFEYDKAINLTFTADEALTSLPEGAIIVTTLAGDAVDAAVTFDAQTQSASVLINTAEVGDVYKMAFNSAVLDKNYIKNVGTSSFEVEARLPREDNYVMNDTFDDENANGWYLGEVADEAYKGTIEFVDVDGDAGNKALRVNAKMNGETETADTQANAYQTNLTKKLGGGIEFEQCKKIVVKTRVKHTNANARFYLKYNRPDSVNLPDLTPGRNLYTLFCVNRTYGINAPHGIKDGTTMNFPNDNFYSSDLTDKWVDVTMVLDGYNNTATVTAKIDGIDYTQTEGLCLKQPEAVYAYEFGKNYDTSKTFDALERLTFVFRQSQSDTLDIDYIKVYETSKLTATLSDNIIYADDALELKLSENYRIPAEAISVKDASGNATGVKTQYDAETQILKVTPAETLEAGEYTLAINSTALAADGFDLDETAFDFVILNEDVLGTVIEQQFETAEDVEDWLIAPTTENKYDATVEQTTFDNKGVLKVAANANMTSVASGSDKGLSAAHFNMPDKLYFKQGAKILIKTRFYHEITDEETTNARASFKYNRPFALDDLDFYDAGNNLGVLFAEHTGSLGVKTGQYYADTDNPLDRTDPILTEAKNKWIDLEMKLDFVNNKAVYYAKETGSSADFTIMEGTLTTKYPSDALESLAVLFRGTPSTIYFDYITIEEIAEAKLTIDAKEVAGNAGIGAYVIGAPEKYGDFSDNVDIYGASGVVESDKTFDNSAKKVVLKAKEKLEPGNYTVKFDADAFAESGLNIISESEFAFTVLSEVAVNDDFEGENALDDWCFRNNYQAGQSADIVEENGNSFLRVSFNGTYANGTDGNANEEGLVYSKNFTNGKFVRDMDNYTILEMKLRTNANNLRKYIKFNYPTEKTQYNCCGEYAYNTRVAWAVNMGGDFSGKFVVMPHNSIEDMKQGDAISVGEVYEINQWYTVKTIYNNVEGTASYYVYNADGSLFASVENEALTAWWYNYDGYDKQQPMVMHTIEDISIQFRNDVTVVNETFDIDDIKIYNSKYAQEIIKAELLGEDGRDINGLETNVKIIPTFTLDTDSAENFFVISAAYKDGILTEIKTATVPAGQTYAQTDGYIFDDVTGVEVKAFIWKDSSSMVPVGKMDFATEPQMLTVYVQTYGNDETGTGEENSSVASVERALEILNEQKQENVAQFGEIVVGGGEYYTDGSIAISSENSFENGKLVIRAVDGATPVFTNGIPFELSKATLVTDTAITSRLTDQNAKDSLYVIDLTEKVALSDIPAAGYPGSYDVNKWISSPVATDTLEVFADGSLMTVARYPNNGYENVISVVNEGAIPRYWEDDYIGRDEYVKEGDRNINDNFIITYDYDNAANWGKADQALMFGFWKYDWATQTVPLTDVDTSSKTITSGLPSRYGVNAGARYYVFNLLEEIDAPGEYFIDRNTGKMYFYMPENMTAESKIVVSTKKDSVFNISNTKNVVLDGLEIGGSRGNGINVNGSYITVKNCEIANTANEAIKANGTRLLIDNCYIHDVNGGVYLSGGDIRTLSPSYNVVSNCEIENFSRITKTYTGAINLSGVGNTATHNELHNSEHQALSYSGVYNTVSYNEIYDVCREADDAGAIYVGRSWTNRGNKIIGNYIHDITPIVTQTYGCSGIFYDDHYAGIYIEGNVLENITGNGIKGNGGREATITNNVFVNCSTGVNIRNASSESFVNHYTGLESSYYRTDVWKNAFPELYNILNNYPEEHRDNVVTNNLAYKCTTALSFGEKVTPYLTNTGNYDAGTTDPGFADAANGNYAITASAMETKIPGFKTIEFDSMGR